MALCKACGAYMLWVKLDSGKPIPVDPDPLPDDRGAVAAKTLDSGVLVGYVRSQRRPLKAGYWTYTPHHSTCPNWKPRPAEPPATQPDPLF